MEQRLTAVDLITAPLKGLLFCMFLPAAGLAITVGLLGVKLYKVSSDILFRAAAFGWRPSEAYLSGKSRSPKKKSRCSSDG